MVRRIALALFVCSLAAGQASAQNWSFDARKVALGSPGSGENLASQMIEEESDYRAVVLPFGLFQVFLDFGFLLSEMTRHLFNPESDFLEGFVPKR